MSCIFPFHPYPNLMARLAPYLGWAPTLPPPHFKQPFKPCLQLLYNGKFLRLPANYTNVKVTGLLCYIITTLKCLISQAF